MFGMIAAYKPRLRKSFPKHVNIIYCESKSFHTKIDIANILKHYHPRPCIPSFRMYFRFER